jgi:hypothetical protein
LVFGINKPPPEGKGELTEDAPVNEQNYANTDK